MRDYEYKLTKTEQSYKFKDSSKRLLNDKITMIGLWSQTNRNQNTVSSERGKASTKCMYLLYKILD